MTETIWTVHLAGVPEIQDLIKAAEALSHLDIALIPDIALNDFMALCDALDALEELAKGTSDGN